MASPAPVRPWRIDRLTVTQSTNDDAKAAAEAGEAEGLVIWALEQKSGRGRHGRQWYSPPGNLYSSILLRPACEPSEAAAYGFIAALALHDTVAALLPQAPVLLKWPNDVLAGGKKISGILLEAGPMKNGRLEWLVVGMGLNVETHPENPNYPSTSLRHAGGRADDLEILLDVLLGHFFAWKEKLTAQGFAGIRSAWLKYAMQGRLSVRLPQGAIEGEFAGLNEAGNLILHLAGGEKRVIVTGDIFFPPEPLAKKIHGT